MAKQPRWVRQHRNRLIFLSQPMNGLTDEEILMTRAEMEERARKRFPDEELDFVDSFVQEEAPPGTKPSVYYLGKSIENMAYADLIIFNSEWYKARGCIIEKMVCDNYNVDYIIEGEEEEDG